MDEGYLSIMLESGDTRDDLKPDDEDMAKKIQEAWDKDEGDIFVS